MACLPVEAEGYLVLASNSMMELAATSGMAITTGGELEATDGTMLEPCKRGREIKNSSKPKT